MSVGAVAFSSRCAALLHSVLRVLLVSAGEKMLGIATCTIIAMVADQ